MVEISKGLLALGVAGAGAVTVFGVPGTSQEDGKKKNSRKTMLGGFSGVPAGAGGGGFSPSQAGGGVPSIQDSFNRTVNIEGPDTTTVNVQNQPYAGSKDSDKGSKKEQKSSGGSDGSSGGDVKESPNLENMNTTSDSSGTKKQQKDTTPTDPVTGTEQVTKKATEKPGVQADTPSGVTTELNRQQGYTRTATTTELGIDPNIGGSKKEQSSSGGGGFNILGSIGGDLF